MATWWEVQLPLSFLSFIPSFSFTHTHTHSLSLSLPFFLVHGNQRRNKNQLRGTKRDGCQLARKQAMKQTLKLNRQQCKLPSSGSHENNVFSSFRGGSLGLDSGFLDHGRHFQECSMGRWTAVCIRGTSRSGLHGSRKRRRRRRRRGDD